MLKKVRALVVIASMTLAMMLIPITSVSATGNCSVGKLTVYGSWDQLGGSRTYCYGVNDIDVSSESPTLAVMGPLSNGTFQNDFDSSSSTSGISSVAWDGNGTSIACLYYGRSRSGGLLTWAKNDGVGNLFHDSDNATESIYIYVANFCPA